MSFFPPETGPDDSHDSPQPRIPWWTAPSDEIPLVYPASEIIVRTPHVAIVLTDLRIFSDGVEFRVQRRLRRADLGRREWDDLAAVFTEHRYGAPRGEGGLRYGVQLADGERAIEGQAFIPNGDPAALPKGPRLTRGGGGGNGDSQMYSFTDDLWLWPLPPAGPIEFVLQWPTMDIPEARTYLDATSFAELSARSIRLWP